MTTQITARCQCEDVRFESDEAALLQFICHCEDCRMASKNDFTTTAFFLASATRVTGEIVEQAFTTASGGQTTRASCANCGTLILDKSARFPTLIGVIANTLDPPFVTEPSCHVWVRSKRPNVLIADELPQHDGDIA